ncbi:MAG: transposase, partial [Planctomycetes bacterium]|nr:transposase [Planctomycetota bacterium]
MVVRMLAPRLRKSRSASAVNFGNPQEKIAALKRHLLEGVPVSTICDELGIAPTVFYRWQKELFENGH